MSIAQERYDATHPDEDTIVKVLTELFRGWDVDDLLAMDATDWRNHLRECRYNCEVSDEAQARVCCLLLREQMADRRRL